MTSGISPTAALGPHMLVLNRAEAVESVQKYFGESLAELRELLNAGTQLEVRALQTRSGDLEVVIPIAVLYHRVLALVDSIEILVSGGQSYGARIILRALLEAGWSLDWMLRENVARRAGQYYVADIRRRITEMARVEDGTDEHSRFRDALGPHAHLLNYSGQEGDGIRHNRQQLIRKLRDEPRFREINAEAERICKRWKREPEWYQLFGGPHTLRDLAEKLELPWEYNVFYKIDSSAVHGISVQDHLSVVEGVGRTVPIRNLRECTRILDQTWTVLLRATVAVIRTYREGELPTFLRRFVPNGRSGFDPPEVEVEIQTIDPRH